VIGSVRGTVIERSPAGEVLVEVGGVGYRVLVPMSAMPVLEPGAPTFLLTHLHVREDAMVLFGFPTRDERDTFESLIAVNGVGPKLALAMLSVHPPNALRRVLADDDTAALCLVPGVGKKTAQRLLLELKARLDVPDLDLTGGAGGGSTARAEAREALTTMGFGPDEVRDVLASLPAEGTVETLLRDALKQLAGRS
jgi:Holliday junction DNA helicase RuvA